MLIRPYIFLGLFLSVLVFKSAVAQDTKNYEKALKIADKAFAFLEKKDYKNALKYLDNALNVEPECFEAWQLKGEIMDAQYQFDSALVYYKRSIATANPKLRGGVFFMAARNELKLGYYEDAKAHLQIHIQKVKNYNKLLIERMMRTAEFGAEAIKHPLDYKLINVGSGINSQWDEYLPALTADESEMIFTVMRPADARTVFQDARFEEDLYVSKNINGVWQPRQPLGYPINTGYNEGAHCISPDGKYLFFTTCETPNGYGSCDLFWSKKVNGQWMSPKNMGTTVNTRYWESQPSIAPDGKTIYFLSSRPGGYGGMDIWKTEMVSEGVFTPAVNLGNVINTEYEEAAPYIHKDGKTLYFVSNGHTGMGGMDIFSAQLQPDGSWATPVNLGYPINTAADELNFCLNAAGTIGFMSSDKTGGYGRQDIYCFKVDERIRPKPVTYMKGNVYDKAAKKPLDAKLELIDLETGEMIAAASSDPQTGNFLICIPTGKPLMLNVNRENYLFYSDHFSVDTSYYDLKHFEKDIPLERPDIGVEIVLRNVFFDFNQSVLKEESVQELERLKKLLTDNPTMKIEVSGHTDNIGSESYNKELSLNRAKAVYDYLMQQGIARDRMTYKGYGFSKPIADNATEEGRAENRRTSFTIIAY